MPLSPPLASMGFVGYVRFGSGASAVQVRATSSDISLKQQIDKPDVIDGRFDRSVYQLQPKLVDGSVEFPSIMESEGAGLDPTATLFRLAANRGLVGEGYGRLQTLPILLAYTNRNAAFTYPDCLIDTFKWSVAQSDMVKCNVSVMGLNREIESWEPMVESNRHFPEQSRVVTWNDAVVEIRDPGGSYEYSGTYVRSFEFNLNNNSERYYTLNGKLFPQDITPRKRELMGSVVFLGRLPELAAHAESNEERCSENGIIKFGYQLNTGLCRGTFLVTLPNCIFEIEELSLTNDLFETTVNYHCLPNVTDLTSSDVLETS